MVFEERLVDSLVDTGPALSILSADLYARLPVALAIQPYSRDAPKVVCFRGAIAMIRRYVDAPVEVAKVISIIRCWW